MTSDLVVSQVQSLELQLAVLKAQIKQSRVPSARKAPADLYGACAGLSETTEEDLEAARYRPKWEGLPNRGAPA